MGNADKDYCDECKDVESLAERLEERLLKGALWENRRLVEAGEVYSGVEKYDPVLRSHCRLTE